jgi:hypothetical protein
LKLIYFGFNISTIWFEELAPTNFIRSTIGRNVDAFNLNESYEPLDDALIEEDQKGVSMLIGASSVSVPYFLFKDEIDIVTLKYFAQSELSFTVTDKIKVPLEDINVKIYYGNQLYGTRINSFLSYPSSIKSTNPQGQVTLRDVPRGEYRIDVLNDDGSVLQTFAVFTNKTVSQNLLITPINHFPQTIFIFSGISLLFMGIGYIIFTRKRK